MLLFFALGNHEEKYLKTKHNIGRVLLEKIAESEVVTFVKAPKYHFARARWGGQEVVFLYSSGYMNQSGEALQAFLSYYKLDLADESDFLVVLQDDSDQSAGQYKLVQGGGSAGHRGIDSIYKHILPSKLDLSRVWRLKIGIRPPGNQQKSETFVLHPLSELDYNSVEVVGRLLLGLKAQFTILDWAKIQQAFNTTLVN